MESFGDGKTHDDAVSAFSLAVQYEMAHPLPVFGDAYSLYHDTGYISQNDMRQHGRHTINAMNTKNDFKRLL